jgi:hypothetical protein
MGSGSRSRWCWRQDRFGHYLPDRSRRLLPQARREPGDGSLAVSRRRGYRKLCSWQRHASGVVVYGNDVPTARVEHPLRDMQATAGGKGKQDLPVSIAALACVPLHVIGVRADLRQPLSRDLA